MKTKSHGGARPGAGRPPLANPRKIRAFKATDEEWQKIREKAREAGLTASEYIRKKILGE